jgi:fibronectin-binding autotransporter adhesin
MSAINRKVFADPARARLLRSTSIAAAAAFLAFSTGAVAQNLTWDTAPAAGFQAGNGNWNFADTEWSLSAGAGDSDQVFVDGANLTFGPADNATVTINGGPVSPASIIFSGDGYVIAGAGANSLDVTGSLNITVTTAGDTAQITAPLTMASGETVTFTGASNGELQITGGINPGGAVGGTFVAAGETLTIDNNAAINANISNTGSITTSGGDIGGNLTVSGGTFTHNTAGSVTGDTTVSGGTLNANGGDFGVTGVVLNTGTLNYTGDSTGDVTGNGGTLTVSAAGILRGNLTNDGTTATNNGQITGTLDVLDGTVTNAGTGTITGATTVNGAGAVLNANGGDFTGGVTLDAGTVNYNGDSTGNLTANGGNLNINDPGAPGAPGGLGILRGNLANAGATTVVAGQITGTVDVTDGTLTNQGTGDIDGLTTINGAGAVVNANGGDFNGGITLTTGDLNYNGDSAGNVTANGGTVDVSGTGILRGTLNNAGAATVIAAGGQVTGSTTLSAGSINNAGTIDDNVAVSGGTLTNTNDITGTVGITGTGTVNNNGAGATITGLVTVNSATATLNANGGDFTAGVSLIDGDVNYGGDSSGNVTATGGTLDISGTGILRGTLNNGGTAVTTIAAGGQVTGATTIGGGTVDNGGTFGGTVLVNGTGTLNNNGAGTITGLTTVNAAGATLNANGGDFTGGLTLTNGDVNYTGDSSGNVTANGGTLDIGATGILRGTLNNGGATTVIAAGGQVTGATTVSGGSLANDGTIDDNVSVSGAGTLTNTGSITGTVGIAGAGVVNNNVTGNIAGVVTVNNGTLNANGGTFTAAGNGIVNAGGTVNILADTNVDISHTGGTTTIALTGAAGPTLTGNISQSGGGTVTNNGGVSGNATVNGGTFANNETVGGTLTMGGGTFNNNAGGAVTGLATVNGGTLVANGGGFGAGILANGGAVDINANTATGVTNAGADVDIASAVTLTGGITQSAGSTTNNGIITGNVGISGGTFENDDVGGVAASVGGNLTISGGSFDNETLASVAGTVSLTGGTLNMNGGTFTAPTVTNNGGTINVNASTAVGVANNTGTLSVDAAQTLTGNVTNGGTVDLNGAVAGTLGNSGDVNAANGSSVTGIVTNNSGGDIIVANAGTATFGSGITNLGGGTVTIGLGSTLSTAGNLIDNRAGAVLNSAGTTDALVANNGTVNAATATFNGIVANGGTISATNTTFNALVGNSGLIVGTGNLTFNGALNSSGTINLTNGSVADRLFLNASSNLNGTTLGFDVNLNPVPPPANNTVATADRLVMGAGTVLSGNITLAFNSLAAGGVDIDDLVIIDAAGAAGDNYTIVGATGLPAVGGKFTYNLATIDGDTVLQNQLNPGITSLAGNVTLTQSLIGSIINRPSSPFVSGLAYDDPDPCGVGVWGRAIAGTADATGDSTSDIGGRSTSELSANFAGVQLGGDFACFNGFVRGWDLAAGGIGGVNLGSVDQPVRVPGLLPGSPLETTSITKADFLQYYAGVYATASRGPLAFDLQYRLEKTDFTVNNTAVGNGVSLGITDSDFSSKAQTLSGSASYGIPIGDSNFAIVPTVGFAWTRTKTDPIVFDNGDTLQIDDFDSQTAFVGATVARTIFSESGDSLQRQFITASYYNDFADDPTAVFNFNDGMGNPAAVENLVNENLGAYTELSAGWNYVRILNPGQIGPARQLDASIRADARVGDQLNSYGVTGQVRLQF